jgi:phage terminase large subunit-like protein
MGTFMNARSLRRAAVLGVVCALASVSAVAGSSQAATPAPSRTVLTTTTPSAVPGQGVKLKAVVKPVTGAGLPTGTVTFNEGATVLGSTALVIANNVETAKLTVNGLAYGAHPITATYSGGASYAASTSLTVIVTITKAGSTTTVVATPTTTPGRYKFNATVRLVLPSTGIATGLVTYVVDGGAPQIVAVNAFGKAPLTVTFIVGSVHAVTATYDGSASVATSTGTITITA